MNSLTLFEGQCGEDVHEVVCLTFSPGTAAGGGADGSMIIFPYIEPNFSANNCSDPFLQRYKTISAGDLIQFAGAIGGFLPTDVIALLASHTIVRSEHINPTIEKVPLNSTPFDIESHFLIAVVVSRTACTWQGFINIDCSNVIPIPVPAYPAMKTQADIQQACILPFLSLATDPGQLRP
ncbi:heme peroxidase [Gautieria morchelliformis]|nr:heme peroxidase [Gautieria morchelliformis]